jgi:hypothetical protein
MNTSTRGTSKRAVRHPHLLNRGPRHPQHTCPAHLLRLPPPL